MPSSRGWRMRTAARAPTAPPALAQAARAPQHRRQQQGRGQIQEQRVQCRVARKRVASKLQRVGKESQVPEIIPAAQPMKSAQALNQRVYTPRRTAGSVWMIHTPPSSCSWMVYCVGTNRVNHPGLKARCLREREAEPADEDEQQDEDRLNDVHLHGRAPSRRSGAAQDKEAGHAAGYSDTNR